MLKTLKGELELALGHLALSVNQVQVVNTERHHDIESMLLTKSMLIFVCW